MSPFTIPSTRARERTFLAWILAGALLLLAAGPAQSASREPARGPNGMVVSPEPSATEIGLDVLRSGGNAVDAAVATALALAVTYPRAGSLGGGGFLLYRSPDGTHAAIDFREVAPAALAPELFRDETGEIRKERTRRGGLAVGVPGTPSGLVAAHERWGSKRWADLVRPAIRLARKGFPVSRTMARVLRKSGEDLANQQAAREIFAPGGGLLAEGELLRQPDLARTLKRLARDGAPGFYRGPTAEGIVRSVRELGGVMTLRDLAEYRAVFREPLLGTYRGFRIVTFPPPSSGGVALLQILAMLEPHDLASSGSGSSRTVHRMVEAERRAYADRSRWLGDPDFVSVPLATLLDPGYLRARASTYRSDAATPSTDVAPGPAAPPEPTQTLHFSVADSRGGVVSLTTTLNSYYGAAIVGEGTGVLLNNEIDDFALAPGLPNQFGLTGGDANAIAPGKRPLSSMTPTIVEAEEPGARPYLVLGSPGGSTIITTVLQILVNVVDHGMTVQEAVDAPRFHHQWLPDRIDHEERAFPEDVRDALLALGHRLHERDAIGNASAIGLDETGAFVGAADPRFEGRAAGF